MGHQFCGSCRSSGLGLPRVAPSPGIGRRSLKNNKLTIAIGSYTSSMPQNDIGNYLDSGYSVWAVFPSQHPQIPKPLRGCFHASGDPLVVLSKQDTLELPDVYSTRPRFFAGIMVSQRNLIKFYTTQNLWRSSRSL